VEAGRSADEDGQSNIQIKYPVCLDCFELIIRGVETKIHKHEGERDVYMRELSKIEKKIQKAKTQDESAMEAELRMLEAEEEELDAQLERLEEEEKGNEFEFQKLVQTKD
jgi:septal ring factor EnvC (AmiA/AmiB activator)